MANTLDSVTAATKLRRDEVEVQVELEEKRREYSERMDRVKEREDELKVRRQELQEKLVQFYKYIQENEIKRNRANKKALAEEKAKQERHARIIELSKQAKDLERQKQESREKYLKFVKYQKYLEEVLQHNDNEEYQDAKDIIRRWQTLEENKRVLQKRKTQQEEELAKNKVSLSMKKQKKKNASVDLQNQLGELQNSLESIQKRIKSTQTDLDGSISRKSDTTKTIGQVRMAVQNLYDRCVTVNPNYKARAGGGEEGDMVAQLTVIGDCLEDYLTIVARYKEKKEKDRQQAMQSGLSSPMATRARGETV